MSIKAFPLWIGWRFFTAGNRNRLASFIALLAIAGLVLGVALMIVVMSVMNGFDREMRERVLAVVPHLRLFSDRPGASWEHLGEKIVSEPGIIGAVELGQLNALLRVGPVTAPVALLSVGQIWTRHEHAADAWGIPVPLPKPGAILLSRALADKLGVDKGARLSAMVVSTLRDGRSALPSVMSLEVAGIYNTHTAQDIATAFISPQNAARLGEGQATETLRIVLEDVFEARQSGYRLIRDYGPGLSFIDWLQTHGNLYQAVQMSRQLVALLVFLVVAVAAFNIVSMLVVTVVDKRAEVAILKTLGADKRMIRRAFVVQGALIGFAGTALGVTLGVLGSLQATAAIHLLEQLLGRPFLSLDVYPIDYIPSDLRAMDVMLVAGVALLLNAVATLLPARKAMAFRPAEILRHE